MKKQTIKYLTPHETKELYAAVSKDSSRYAKRNKAIFYLAKYCALRVSEVGMLTLEDVSISQKQIYCSREKGSVDNTIRIINQEVLLALSDYYYERIQMDDACSNALFLSNQKKPISRKMLDKLIKKYAKDTTIPPSKHHFHILRHTRAIELAELGINVQDIQWWLGHKNISNTLIYLQFTTSQQDALYKFLEHKEEGKK